MLGCALHHHHPHTSEGILGRKVVHSSSRTQRLLGSGSKSWSCSQSGPKPFRKHCFIAIKCIYTHSLPLFLVVCIVRGGVHLSCTAFIWHIKTFLWHMNSNLYRSQVACLLLLNFWQSVCSNCVYSASEMCHFVWSSCVCIVKTFTA